MEIGSSIVVRGPTPNHRKNQSNVIYDLRVRRKNSVQELLQPLGKQLFVYITYEQNSWTKKNCSYRFWTPLPLYQRLEMVSPVDKLAIEAQSYQAIGYRVSKMPFLDASSHLYKRVSIGPSVGQSIPHFF